MKQDTADVIARCIVSAFIYGVPSTLAGHLAGSCEFGLFFYFTLVAFGYIRQLP